jgi:plasmid maintenance system antidote protein VapI
MKKVIKLTESDLYTLIREKLQEQSQNYMFYSNLEQIIRQAQELLEIPKDQIESLLNNGHDWADDHVSKSKENLDHVYEFFMNELNSSEEMTEGKKKKKKRNTTLCARGKAAAKAKYDVYPSAYANGFAVQVCKGDIAGLDGKKRCSPPYC